MKQMNFFFKAHGWILLFGLIVGAISVAPHVFASRALGADYKGIPFMYLDDEDVYLVRMREIVDGHWPVGSPFFAEYKNERPLMMPLMELLYAALSLGLRISLPGVLVLTKFLFPAGLYLLGAWLTKRLVAGLGQDGKSVTWEAVAGGVLATLGYDLVYDLPRAVSVLRGTYAELWLPVWTRPVNPVTGGLLVFGYLILLWQLIQRRRAWLAIPVGGLLGLMVSYFFSWGIALSITAVLGVFYLLRRDWRMIKLLCLALLVGFGVGGMYWLALAPDLGQSTQELMLKHGLFLTRTPLLNKTLLAAFAIFIGLTAFIASKAKNLKSVMAENWWMFCAAFLLGGLWSLSQQIVTGRTIWPYHFVQYTKPLASIALIVAAAYALRPYLPRLWRGMLAAVIGVCVLSNVVLVRTYRNMLEDFRSRQSDMETFAWLNAEAPKDCVVLAVEEVEHLSRLIPGFTHCNVYLSTVTFSGVPEDRVRHNFFISLRLRGVTPETVRAYLGERKYLVRETFFSNWTELFHLGDESWLDQKIGELTPAYEEFYRSDFRQQLRRYRLDYVMSQRQLAPEDQATFGIGGEMRVGKTWVYRP